MTSALISEEAPGVKAKDLRAFPLSVSKAVQAIVNRRGVKYRIFKDGNHLHLYPPDRTARPFKLSAHRPEEANIRHLQEFVDKWLPPPPTDDRPAKPEELAPLMALNSKPPEQRPAPEAETVWRVHHRRTGEPTTFETDGTRYRCTEPGCPFMTAVPRKIGAHAANHKSARLAKTDGRGKRRAKPWTGNHPKEKTPLNAERVKELRKRSARGWQEIGREIGITGEGIRQWLVRGEAPSVWIEPFAKALGVTPELLTGSDPLPNSLPPLPEPEPTPEPTPEPVEPEPLTAPEVEPSAPIPTNVATGIGREYLTEIARLAHAALGEPDAAAELAATRAELERVRTELDEANARLDLLNEAWEAVGKR